MKLNTSVKKEIFAVLAGVAAFSILMLLIFVLLGRFDLSVALGTAAGASLSALNFLLLGITIQFAASCDRKKGAALIRFSFLLRTIFIFMVLFAIFKSDLIYDTAAVIALLFPRLTIVVRGITEYVSKRISGQENKFVP